MKTEDGEFNYKRYLASREWALLKRQVRERSGGKCERCPKGEYKQTHHLTYERIGHELLDDLLGVCKECHEFLAGTSDYDPRTADLVAGTLARSSESARQWVVSCPVCAFDYGHIIGVFTRKGSDTAEAQVYSGTPVFGSTEARRSALVIVFDGECEHVWEMVIQQHKGNNLVHSRAIAEVPDGMPRWNAEPEVKREQPHGKADSRLRGRNGQPRARSVPGASRDRQGVNGTPRK